MSIINVIVGALSLVLGRQLFWLFVAVAGFALGFDLALSYLGDQAPWLILGAALVTGLIGALLAQLLQRLAVAVAGFIAGGYLLLNIADILGIAGSSGEGLSLVAIGVFVLGGLIGLVLVAALFDVALILLSSGVGASVLTQAAPALLETNRTQNSLIFLVLLLFGIVFQWMTWRRLEGSAAADD